MGTTELTDGSMTQVERSAGEQRLAGYFDDLIAAMIAQRATAPDAVGSESCDAVTNESRQSSPSEGAGDDGVRTAPAPRPCEPSALTEETPSGHGPGRNGRSSMREELLALFRNNERLQTPTAVAPLLSAAAEAAGRTTLAAEPHRQPERSAPQSEDTIDLVPSGLDSIDERLGGGFAAGLHLVSGKSATDKAAFLESVGWEAIASRRPVVYYALRDGVEGTRERLERTLTGILGGRPRPGAADRAFEDSVAPWLSLVETVPESGNAVDAFLGDLRQRVRDSESRHQKAPLLLLDDLDHLLLLTGPKPLVDLLSRLDGALVAGRMAGLVAMTKPYPPTAKLEDLPSRAILALAQLPGSPNDRLAYMGLDIRTEPRTGRTGVVPLALDRRSGLFTPRP